MKAQVCRSLFPLVALLLTTILSCNDEAPFAPTKCGLEQNPNVITLGTTRASWHPASKPIQLDESYEAGRILRHNTLYDLPASEVYDRELVVGEGVIRPFRMIYRPTDGAPSWAGVMKYLGLAYPPERLNMLHMRVQGEHGRMHIELGKISEDLNGDGLLSAEEDYNHDGYLGFQEDVGLDGLPDSLEPGYDPQTNPDPNHDNWFFLGDGKCPVPVDQCERLIEQQEQAREGNTQYDSVYFEWLNGTEGNLYDITSGGRPDSEKLSPGAFNTTNSYFSWTIDLAETVHMVAGSENENGWKSYELKLGDDDLVDTICADPGQLYPVWNDLDYVRVWFESEAGSSTDTVLIADWSIVLNPGIPTVYDTIPCVLGWWDVPVNTESEYIRDYEYQTGRIFDLGPDTIYTPGDSVIYAEIWEMERNDNAEGSRYCTLYVDPNDISYEPALVESSRMIPVAPGDFAIYHDPDRPVPYVVFNTPRHDGLSLGMYLEIKRSNGSIDTIGDLSGDTLVLKTLRHSIIFDSPSTDAWQFMWRNVYQLPVGIPLGELRIDVKKGIEGSEANPNNLDYQVNGVTFDGEFIEILGLDQYNQTGDPVPDGLVDDYWRVFRPELGLLIFPHRTPFDTDTTYHSATGEFPPLRLRVPQLYNYSSFSEKVENSAYYLQIETRQRVNPVQLPCNYVPKGCVAVYLNGRRLTAGVDYDLDLAEGLLYLLIDEALDPAGTLRICFG